MEAQVQPEAGQVPLPGLKKNPASGSDLSIALHEAAE